MATRSAIAHPHGQIYAYDHVPRRQSQRLAAGWAPEPQSGDRLVAECLGWRAWVPFAPTFPIAVEVAPLERMSDLASMSDGARNAFSALLVDVLARLDRLY